MNDSEARRLFPGMSGHVQQVEINKEICTVIYDVEGDLVGDSWQRISYLTMALDSNGNEISDTDALDSIREFIACEVNDYKSIYI